MLVRRLSLELWARLYDFSDEKGCSVRLDWDLSSMPTPELRDSQAAVARLVVDLPWVESFSYCFRYPQHMNLLELDVLISLIRGLVDRGLGKSSCALYVDSRVVLGSVCKWRSSSRRGRVNFRLRRLGGLLSANNLSLDLCCSTCVGYPLGQIPATHRRVFYSVCKCRTALPLFSRQLHVSPEALRQPAREPEPVCNACEKNRESR